MKTTYSQGDLKIDFAEVVEAMSPDDKKQILKSIAVSRDVIDWVCDFICNNDEDGWWDGCSPEIRQQFLQKVEQTQLGQSWLSCYWRPWDNLRDKLKEIEAQREVYKRLQRAMYDYDSPYSDYLRKQFNADECSHYVTKLADEKIKEIEKLVTDTLRECRKGSK